ncbi:PREDICTED: interferon-inducible GTPase 1-like isoform X1 [Acropora digitifera]|uniref:interferon-inducible GTPase 1-like isoform X1 n=1 Tax=Acropora digitifera TaxID=70779 RepID=UPI00077A05EF|nr:PREDICTED: interferon-inducible GTPase 1-like isoform X1 [Acropora digitifera]XP_015768755.1 PREDICTED: interferon-inducible GTPase 1-like isoform X1 [Acropora digitifera]
MATFLPECFEDDFVKTEMKELQHEIDVSGVSNIKEILPKRLESWREVEVNVAITGDSGSGKSSFINAIRELYEDDDGAAPVDVIKFTREPTAYDHPTNSNIKFWNLPGIGTPNYPDMETYVQKVQLEKYHTFLIFTHTRFTNNDLLLAKEIRSMKKSFFFIRTKIDVDFNSMSRLHSFNEEDMLMKIRRYCAENLGDLLSNEEDIFLISNHELDKWDFERLTQAILDALTRYQRESLTLSLGEAIMSSSTGIFQRKVNVLKARIWKLAAVSAAAAIAPLPGLSVFVDAVLILSELSFYRSQLGLPAVGSAEFAKLSLATKEKVLQVGLTTAAELSGILAPYATEATVEEVVRYLPFVGVAVASGMSFGATLYALYQLLGAVEDAALSVLKEAHEKTSAELKID